MKEGEDKRLADYLLGNLPESEQIRLEEEYLADPSAQNRLLMVEDELVDAYLQGQLTPIERERFQAGFLASPRGRRKLELAKSLTALAADHQHRESLSTHTAKPFYISSWIRWAFATVALALVLVLAWSNWTRIWRHSGSQNVASKNPADKPDEVNNQTPPKPSVQDNTPAPRENSSPGPVVSSIISVVLRPAARDVEQSQQVHISRATLQVQIGLELLQDNHASYRVELLDAKDDRKWSAHGLKPQATASTKTITFKLPANLFGNGEYTFLISSDEDSARPIAEYPFWVRKE